ncbi:hypothetical protein [Maledivibacter halophilus]|uniref:Uncharacterized protein n=1 Tax=Maledivibacter halophilus TaxID=36842 RepID=A0A1T5KDT3_9FIRM|nr:hypothetical protein [Maledivibacter halophilus]SKC61856.1 hypothetical protein SAMN02194393_01719 [Maledivibacter halophilus]
MTTGTDTVIYTGKKTEEELKKEINKLITTFLIELESEKSNDEDGVA